MVAALERHQLPANSLTLEITETTAMSDADASMVVLQRVVNGTPAAAPAKRYPKTPARQVSARPTPSTSGAKHNGIAKQHWPPSDKQHSVTIVHGRAGVQPLRRL